MPLLKTFTWQSLNRVWLVRPAPVAALGPALPLYKYRGLLTLAIETSCDDTSVAILERNRQQHSSLHFHSTITSDNRPYGGIHPLVALESHQRSLATLVNTALEKLPAPEPGLANLGNALLVEGRYGVEARMKPDFVAVTRGPGMRSSLNMGLDMAKGLAVAWRVPLMGVHHMQAHALTPRLVASLERSADAALEKSSDPGFPFLSLLVSGGHTVVVLSKGLADHRILVETTDIAVGDAIDKCARDILPSAVLEGSETVRYGQQLEDFAFPDGTRDYGYIPPSSSKEGWKPRDTDYGWALSPPLSSSGSQRSLMKYSFSGIASAVKRIARPNSEMPDIERRVLAQETMRLIFEHLASRLLMVLNHSGMDLVNTVVVSGGVASNRYLRHILRSILDQRRLGKIRLLFPPPNLCVDNAAMIAWAGMEMWDAGWRSDLDITARKEWPLDALSVGIGDGSYVPRDKVLG